MPEKVKITNTLLKRLPAAEKQYEIWDDKIDRFGVRVYTNGQKSFFIRYFTEHGQRKMHTLGRWGEDGYTLDEARNDALDKLKALEVKGVDPKDETRAKREAIRFGELADLYLEEWAKPRKKTWETDEARLKGDSTRLKPWKNTAAEAITTANVKALHIRIGAEHPYEANRVLALVSKIFNFGREAGYVACDNPCEPVTPFIEESRDRYFTPAEVKALWRAMEGESLYVCAAMKLLLLTGSRVSALLRAEWSHVDLDAGHLFEPEVKTTKGPQRSHFYALNAPAREILANLPRREGSPWVFQGKRKGAPLTTISKRWEKMRGRAGLPDAQMHDCRRTLATWLADEGYSELTIKLMLAHAVRGVTGAYIVPKGVTKEAKLASEDFGRLVIEAVNAKGDGDEEE